MKKVLWCTIGMLLVFLSCTKELDYDGEESNRDVPKETVNVIVKTPGSLSTVLGHVADGISNLTINGELNGTDILYLRKLCGTDAYGKEGEGSLKFLD